MGPQQPNGHVGNATRIELLQGPVCDLGSVWHGVWQGKGQRPWVYDPLRNTRNMTPSASTLDVQLSKLVQKGPLEAGIQQALSKRTRGAVPGLSFSSVPGLPGSLPKGFRQALPSCPRPLQVHKASVSPSGPRWPEGPGRRSPSTALGWGQPCREGARHRLSVGSSPLPQHHPGQDVAQCVLGWEERKIMLRNTDVNKEC